MLKSFSYRKLFRNFGVLPLAIEYKLNCGGKFGHISKKYKYTQFKYDVNVTYIYQNLTLLNIKNEYLYTAQVSNYSIIFHQQLKV